MTLLARERLEARHIQCIRVIWGLVLELGFRVKGLSKSVESESKTLGMINMTLCNTVGACMTGSETRNGLHVAPALCKGVNVRSCNEESFGEELKPKWPEDSISTLTSSYIKSKSFNTTNHTAQTRTIMSRIIQHKQEL